MRRVAESTKGQYAVADPRGRTEVDEIPLVHTRYALLAAAVGMNDIDLPFAISSRAVGDPFAIGRDGGPPAPGVHHHLRRNGAAQREKQSETDTQRAHAESSERIRCGRYVARTGNRACISANFPTIPDRRRISMYKAKIRPRSRVNELHCVQDVAHAQVRIPPSRHHSRRCKWTGCVSVFC